MTQPHSLAHQDVVGPSADNVAVDVVVVGAGIAGLTLAHDCARAGLTVRVFEESAAVGGLVAAGALGSLTVDVGAESFATRGGSVEALIIELGLGESIVEPLAVGARLVLQGRGNATRVTRIPRDSVLGIPAHPFAAEVRAVIGWAGALRASLDRVLPARVGFTHSSVADVVRARQGARVLDRLVTPICLGIHSTSPALLDIDAVAPGLRSDAALRGSLLRAVQVRATGIRSGSAVRGLDGGMFTLAAALAEKVRADGGTIALGTAVTQIKPAAAGTGYLVRTRAAANPADGAVSDISAESAESTVLAREVVVATALQQAVDLVEPLLGHIALGRTPPTGQSVAIVTLHLLAPLLDALPIGTGAIVAPGARGVAAKALTHSTAKWPWLRARLGGHEHLVRLSYQLDGAGNERGDDEDQTATATVRALRDSSAILGLPETALQLIASRRTLWTDAVTQQSPEHRRWLGEWLERAAARDRLTVIGAWVAGTGLASVVPHARESARRIIQRTPTAITTEATNERDSLPWEPTQERTPTMPHRGTMET